MLNVTAKSLLAAIAISMAFTSCGDKDKEGAMALYQQSQEAVAARNFAGAVELLDTLNSRYPEQTAIRRDGLRVRAAAIEGMAIDSIATSSQALAEATLAVENLRGDFRHIEGYGGLDGYFIPKKAPQKVMTATGIQPRVSEKGLFYMVVNVQGKAIGLRSLEFLAGGESVVSSELSPMRVIKVEGSESASFNPEDLVGVGAWVKNHSGAMKVVMHGSKSNTSVKIDKDMRQQIVDCYDYSSAIQAQRLASIKREKFERMLATARDQLANLPAPQQQQ